jgi:hypothetical protein
MHWVIADDMNGNTFYALTEDADPEPEKHVRCWVFVSGENGWGAEHGEVKMLMLKKNPTDGHFVS